MVIHRDVPRTAAFTWSPGPAKPLIATGTKAGAVDADFSSDTKLELWDLDLNAAGAQKELQPLAQVSTDSRFHDLAWAQPKEEHSRGIIAGALESGSLDLWDAAKLLKNQEDAVLSRTTKHTGAIKAIQFNAFRHDLLATAGAKGEIYIWDANNIENPFRLGGTAGRADDFECLDWNKQVPHIMVTGSSNGFVTVWDVKAKKESLNLNNNGRKAVSAVAWDPDKSTRLITAVPLDSDPLILVWDLRNANAPEKILRGHEGGVMSLSWCGSDHNLLLSCGKDNRNICWNPQSGEAYGELPVVTNWTFQTRWNPHNPSIFGTASFDGKIAVRSIQNTKREATENQNDPSLEGADFFDKASSQPQSSSFSLPKAPKWLECPNGASFGFGGKLVSFSQVVADGKPSQKSVVRISNFTVDDKISGIAEGFAKSMQDGDLKAICQTHISSSESEAEKNDWNVIETLLEPSPRRALIRYLGVTDDDEAATETNGGAEDSIKPKDVDEDDDANFFDKGADDEDLLPRLASSKGVKTSSPFHISAESDSDADKEIARALTQGQFVKAMDICLEKDRLSDALMIAMCGGDAAKEKVKQAYFKKQSSGPNYIRLLASIIGKNLWDVVHNADLSNWKEVMASLCTYAREEFSDLCEALGDRLEEQSHDGSNSDELRQSASFCYIAGSNLEKVARLWIADLQRNEEASLKSATSGSGFSIHATALQSFIEKVTVFREAVHYEDTNAESGEDSNLAPLYQRYIEYADIVSAHGQLQIADQYLKLLPKSYQTAQSARERVQQATKPAPAQRAAPAQRGGPAPPSHGYMPPMPSQQPISPQNQYGPNAYAPSQAPATYNRATPYAPPAPYQQPQAPNMYQPQHPGPMAGPPPSGPPRNMNASPSIPPPSQDRKIGNWNDTPEDFFKAPTPRGGTPRRGTPNPNPAPGPNQYAPGPPPSAGMYGQQPSPQTSQPPPPPKGASGPPRTAGMPAYNLPERPPSASNPYGPNQGSQAPSVALSQAPPPRGPSPYNPPPATGSAAGGSSRYAPTPAAAPTQQAPPPGSQRSPPPPNPYAAPPNMGAPPPGRAGPPPTGPPPAVGAAAVGPPPRGPPRQDSPANAPPPAAAAAAPQTTQHPPGDRSHIPSQAQPIHELLSADMQRVKAKAPASFKNHVVDTEKRLNILFDHLNNETLLTHPTISEMVQLAEAIGAKDYDRAMQFHLEIVKNRNEECTNWMTGVKRLISMSRATP